MIFGVFERIKDRTVNPNWFKIMVETYVFPTGKGKIYTDDQVGFSNYVPFRTKEYRAIEPVTLKDKSLAVVFTGRIYNYDELSEALGLEVSTVRDENASYLILELYKKYKMDFVKKLNGEFAFALWDKAQQLFILSRDRLGIEPLYYHVDEKRLLFSSYITPILKYPGVNKELNLSAIGKFLLFNYNPGLKTLFNQIYKLSPAHHLTISSKDIKIKRYWKLTFGNTSRLSEQEISERLTGHLRDSVSIRLDNEESPGIFLSGGMDSSTVLALASEKVDKPLQTFSYRCKSESFDESHYARLMSKSTDSNHKEIEYSAKDVLLIREIVKEMNEPFCDVGINIATILLGREASQRVNYVFTGDGGDELFGGHPIYEADKIAHIVDSIPGIIKNPFIHMFSSFLSDSDKKKNLIVKIKRFSENLGLPKELLSHRWRIYYQADELKQLLTSSIISEIHEKNLYEDILLCNQEADGPDLLSRSLYSDYHTVLDFYLRRNDLNRKFNLETRYPLLDYRLIEFCAQIPSRLKIKGWFDTKYIFKKAMEKVLPENIVYRRDKLGHSIPLKNWIRDVPQVREFILDYVSESIVKRRGYFNPDYISNLIKDHMSKKRNNSHRLWALAVLEMWLQEHYEK